MIWANQCAAAERKQNGGGNERIVHNESMSRNRQGASAKHKAVVKFFCLKFFTIK
jgi:hypothetical protein